MELVSVILTTYNSERSLQRVLDSILNQKGIKKDFDIELIVVDDCSTDGTSEILKNNNISFLSTPANSGGPNKGRNMGLKKVTGNYICIVDHDDEWLRHKIITQLALTDQAPIVSSGFIVKDTVNNKSITRTGTAANKTNSKFYEKNKTFIETLTRSKVSQNIYFGSILYSAQFKDNLFEEKFGMCDFDWGLRLFHERSSVEACEPLYARYISESNLSLNETYRIKDFNNSIATLELYADKYPIETKKAYKKIHGSMARYFYLVGKMPNARSYFLRSGFSIKMLLYYLTTFAGSKYVKKRFNIFG